MRSNHANYVIQQAVELLPTEKIVFVAEELHEKAYETATHRFGCRTMLRLVRHSFGHGWAAERVKEVLDEALVWAEDLCSDRFGSFVAREIIEFGIPEHRRQIATVLMGNPVHFAKSPHSSNIVGKALTFCEFGDALTIAERFSSVERVSGNLWGVSRVLVC